MYLIWQDYIHTVLQMIWKARVLIMSKGSQLWYCAQNSTLIKCKPVFSILKFSINLTLLLHQWDIWRLNVPVVGWEIYCMLSVNHLIVISFFCQWWRDVAVSESVTGAPTTRTTNPRARPKVGLLGLNWLLQGPSYNVLGLEPDHWDYGWVTETAGRSLRGHFECHGFNILHSSLKLVGGKTLWDRIA